MSSWGIPMITFGVVISKIKFGVFVLSKSTMERKKGKRKKKI